jgi:hypothetical protein
MRVRIAVGRQSSVAEWPHLVAAFEATVRTGAVDQANVTNLNKLDAEFGFNSKQLAEIHIGPATNGRCRAGSQYWTNLAGTKKLLQT